MMIADQSERSQAINPHQSYIVQAPAGSGKTELLIQRYLTLLDHVKSPDEILALTFTRKAANEMRNRIIKSLKSAAYDAIPDSPHAQLTWKLAKKALERDLQYQWNLLLNPNQLRIQTIDSLCSNLTKHLPLLAHFGSTPDLSDQAHLLYREAAQEILSHTEENLAWSHAVADVLLHLDNDIGKLEDLLVKLLSKRDQWLPYLYLNHQDNQIRHYLEGQIGQIITDSLENAIAVFPKQIEDELFALTGLRHAETHPTHKPQWLTLANLFLTKEQDWRKSFDKRLGFPSPSESKNKEEKQRLTENKNRMKALVESLHGQNDFKSALIDIMTLPDAHYDDQQWQILQSLLLLLKISTAQLRVTFQRHGKIDFIENTLAAITALGSDDAPTDLTLVMDYQLQHILIDEFQDTSLTQFQLLEKLTSGWETHDGRTLFVVGDPMQSIYRFREAEVGLFLRMREDGIGKVMLTPLTLSVNFRSADKIIDWNNQHFSTLFPKFNHIATGAVTYTKSTTTQSTSSSDSLVKITGLQDADDQHQAQCIIETIKFELQSHPADNIAILVRARQHLKSIIPALKQAGVPFHAVDIDPLISRSHIQDLLALTRALMHPYDRIAWLAILRAPWCGLSLIDLHHLAANNTEISLFEAIQCTSLSQDGMQRLARIKPIITTAIQQRERFDTRYWLEQTWRLLGGPACLTDETAICDVNVYFDLVSQLSQGGIPLDIDTLLLRMNTLFASVESSNAQVLLMTIHSAKGLEFDTVIVPHLERKNPPDDSPLLAWMERPLTHDKTALLLAPIHATGDEKNPIYDYIIQQRNIKSDYEIDRLLYVAMTRAKKRLYAFYSVTSDQKASGHITPGSFLHKLWPCFKQLDCLPVVNEPIIRTKQKLNARLIRHWHNPYQTTFNVKLATHLDPKDFCLPDNQPKQVGIVIHHILQTLSLKGIQWWQSSNTAIKQHYIQRHLLQAGIMNDTAMAMNKVFTAIENTLSDKRGLWILQPHAEAESEYAISTSRENLIIDRTFIADNVRWIIDYKTTDAIAHPEKYLAQLHKYRAALAKIDSRPIKIGLYFPSIPQWIEY